MDRVGIRELRQQASALLRRVAAGETIEITDRGRPVALLTPLPSGSLLQRLRESGDLMPALDDSDFPPPVILPEGHELPSQVLARLRRDER